MKLLAGAPPTSRLLPLLALVVLGHIALLRSQPDPVVSASVQAAPTFATRQVVAQPPAPPPAPAPPAPAARPVPRATPKPAEPPRPQAQGVPAKAAETTPAPSPSQAPNPSQAPVEAAAPPGPPSSVTLSGLQPRQTAIPAPARVRYDVEIHARGMSVTGKAELNWKHDGEQYEARLEVNAPLIPTRVQTSSGRLTGEGLLPSRFSEKYRTEEATHFERDKGKVTFSNNKPAADLLAGAQDRLSVLVQLSALVAGEPARYTPGTSVAIPTAGTRESDTWVFQVEAEEDLQLPGGHLRGLKLVRLPRKEYDTKVELWLAPRMDYAPVRLRLTAPNGDSVDQRWSSTDKG